MNRRNFMRDVAAGLSMTQLPRAADAAGAETSSPRAWLKTSPFIAVGSWDDMPIFQIRSGGASTDEARVYDQEHSEDTVRKLRDLGVTIAIIDFFKGFGLEAEREHIGEARRLTALLHQHGLRAGLYVGSTIMYETFLIEAPEAEDWFVPDYLGRPVVYPGQPFRKRVYFMHPGYVAYIKRVVRLGVEDLKADLIHFDNTSMQAAPEIFEHPLAVRNFREFLRTKYSPQALKQRLGFSDVRYVVPPKPARVPVVIDDPLFQLWTDFRCAELNHYYDEMTGFIRALNPAVVTDCNPSSGLSGSNTIWSQGISYPGLYPRVDIAWTEEGDEAGVSAEGILVSKIRTYKAASICNTQILTYTAGSGHYGARSSGATAMAESLAFNRQSIGMIGGLLGALAIPATQQQYVRFFRQQFQYYRDVKNVADAAVLYSYASMGFNNGAPSVSFMLLTQALIEARVPFDIIFDEHLEDLSRYRVLVLADQECLSDDQIEAIRQFVNRGGGLVATGETSLYTPERLRRPDFGLGDLFQVHAPRRRARRESALEIPPVRRSAGQGRVSYFAEVKPAVEKPPAARMSSRYWKLPLNATSLIEAVRWAAGEPFSLEVLSPATAVVAELVDQPDRSRRLVHLINYAGGTTVGDLRVSVALPKAKRLRKVTLVSPDVETELAASASGDGGRARFTVPVLHTYTLAVADLA
ncbi:MAG: hypothetical protein ACRD3D_12370 [Terriglobia bacterium]